MALLEAVPGSAAPGGGRIAHMLTELRLSTEADTASIARFTSSETLVLEAFSGPAVLGVGTRLPVQSSSNFSAAADGHLFGSSDYRQLDGYDRALDQLVIASGFVAGCTVPLTLGAAPVAAVTLSARNAGWDYTAAIQRVVEVGQRIVIQLARENDTRVSSRLLICRDDPLAAEGLARVGETELGVEVTAVRPAISALVEHVASPSDLVVTDCYVAGQRVDEQVRTLAVAGVTPRILVIASHDTDLNRAAAAAAGVCGYCPCEAGRAAIAEAFLRAGSGQHIPPLITPATTLEPPLTAREQEVLMLLERGLQVKEVARHLRIAQSTVKGYVRNIFTKLDVHSITAALYVARDNGLLEGNRQRAQTLLSEGPMGPQTDGC